MTLVGINIAEG